jgi:hypothetical protein
MAESIGMTVHPAATVMRNSSARRSNWGVFPFFFFLRRSFRFSSGKLAHEPASTYSADLSC